MEDSMPAKVYFADTHSRSHEESKMVKVARLCDTLNLKKIIKKNEPAAVKLHFGEYGNDTHLNPTLVRQVVDKITAVGGKPFLTDTTTLYSGSRHNAVDHLRTAYLNGFAPTVAGAPVVIADGLFGSNDVPVRINCKHFKDVHIATEIHNAPSMIVLSHFKGHQMAGFGGAVKNLAMGGASVRGKREQHATHVSINRDDCIGCAKCVRSCPQQALSMREHKSHVETARCIGCFECMTVCPAKAIVIDWATEMEPFMERMAEYAYGTVKGRSRRVCYINFVLNVTPDCDCVAWSDMPLVPDVGILASSDPVALDQACLDLVNKAPCLCASTQEKKQGQDIFTARWPHTRGTVQLRHGEAIGLGSRAYELVKL